MSKFEKREELSEVELEEATGGLRAARQASPGETSTHEVKEKGAPEPTIEPWPQESDH